jgi:hypothetical protein
MHTKVNSDQIASLEINQHVNGPYQPRLADIVQPRSTRMLASRAHQLSYCAGSYCETRVVMSDRNQLSRL